MARRPTPILDAIDRLTEDRPVVNAIVNGVRNSAARQNTAITTADVPVVAQDVVHAIEEAPGVAVVETKSGWLSKINWTNAVTILATAFAWIGLDVSAETLAAIVTGIQAVGNVATIVLKTWFTKSITPQSAAKP